MSRDVVWVVVRPALPLAAFVAGLLGVLARSPREVGPVFAPYTVEVARAEAPSIATPLRAPAIAPPARAQAPVPPAPAIVAPPRTRCSIPVSQIGLVADRYMPTNGPAFLEGVAASATGCTIVVWSNLHVFVSRDDGASYTRLASAVGEGVLVGSAAVGADERIVVVRGGRLEVEQADGTLAVRALPEPLLDRVDAGDGWLAVRSRDRLAISADEGRTWRVQAMPAVTSAAVRVDGDGTVHLAAATGTHDPVAYYVGHVDGRAWRPVWTSPPHRGRFDPSGYEPGTQDFHHSVDAFAFGRDGRLHAERYDPHGYQVLSVDASGVMETRAELADPLALAGTTVHGTKADVGARDAHGYGLALWGGRGPVRDCDRLGIARPARREHLMLSYFFADRGEGRWLVGGVAP